MGRKRMRLQYESNFEMYTWIKCPVTRGKNIQKYDVDTLAYTHWVPNPKISNGFFKNETVYINNH